MSETGSTVLPPLADMVRPEELTLDLDQQLPLLGGRTLRTRFWMAPYSTPAPDGATALDPETGWTTFVTPWAKPWLPLNEPTLDEMCGAVILNELDDQMGILVLVGPTEAAERAWSMATVARWVTIGIETADLTTRAIFHRVRPMSMINDRTRRFEFLRPVGGGPSWEVSRSQ